MNQIELPFMAKQSAKAEVQEAGYSPLSSVWDGGDSELLENMLAFYPRNPQIGNRIALHGQTKRQSRSSRSWLQPVEFRLGRWGLRTPGKYAGVLSAQSSDRKSNCPSWPNKAPKPKFKKLVTAR